LATHERLNILRGSNHGFQYEATARMRFEKWRHVKHQVAHATQMRTRERSIHKSRHGECLELIHLKRQAFHQHRPAPVNWFGVAILIEFED
jgi:hypothetical protein